MNRVTWIRLWLSDDHSRIPRRILCHVSTDRWRRCTAVVSYPRTRRQWCDAKRARSMFLTVDPPALIPARLQLSAGAVKKFWRAFGFHAQLTTSLSWLWLRITCALNAPNGTSDKTSSAWCGEDEKSNKTNRLILIPRAGSILRIGTHAKRCGAQLREIELPIIPCSSLSFRD